MPPLDNQKGVDATIIRLLNPGMSIPDIQRRIEALEKENQRLKDIVAGGLPKPKEITTHVDMFKGHPVITFSGPFRPFTIGLRKASVILLKIDAVKHFVENNKSHLANVGQDEPDSPTSSFTS